ncbi:hypothetical protein RSOLAG22IIIB_09448 [Rhizoctonia solani]|uniref:Uncharacterized protein n=1 Tax=Rhizoctonia solani TaxID=456999 RepID=A0A0K6FYE1_9AGAM|nr:hypothetical protein RSOLAG22IIIB_09448 [Rhizoctonia solani]
MVDERMSARTARLGRPSISFTNSASFHEDYSGWAFRWKLDNYPVSNIASTPNGRKLSWLFRRPIPIIVSNLSRLLTFPPFSAIPYTLSYWSKFNGYPSDQLDIIKSLVTSPHVVYSTLTMAHDEMQTIGSLGSASSTVQATCERERSCIYACFAAKDEWVGDEVSSVRAMLDEHRVVVRNDDVPHAFCIGHSTPVAETCSEWIKEILTG